MAKTARRFIVSDPSSPTYLSDHHRTSSSSTASSSTQSPVNPLRTSGSFYTTTTLPKFNTSDNSSQPFSANQFQNGNTNRTAESFNSTILDRVAAERARIRMEFFATYDVMTGVRIAATLGGFFGLMVFLVVYKSRGESEETLKALKDPKIAAVAAAVMQEEEDRELQEAMEATGMSIYPDEYDHLEFRRGRLMSLGNVSAPPMLSRNYRFSSIGSAGSGYSSLIGPHRRFSYAGCGRKSTSVSSRILSAYPMGGSFGIDDYFVETDGDEADDEFDQLTTASVDAEKSQMFLAVPPKGQESRRSSNITCCSTESSYLERRCSALTLGLTPHPPTSGNDPTRRPSSETWDYYYPGIQVIQPTPRTSPCRSESSINEKRKNITGLHNGQQKQQQQPNGKRHSLLEQDSFDCISEYADSKTDKIMPISRVDGSIDTSSSKIIRRAPLASLSSFKISSVDYQDSDLRSLGSDSVFAESYADTDDDMEQFSTDSDEISDAQSPPNTRISVTYSPTRNPLSVDYCSTYSAMESNINNNDNNNDRCSSAHVNNYSHNTFSSTNVSKSSSVNLVSTFETKAIIEQHHHQHRHHPQSETISRPPSSRQFHSRPASYSGCESASSIISVTNKHNRCNEIDVDTTTTTATTSTTTASECVDVNVVVVVDNSSSSNRSIVNPSVILELPVISTQEPSTTTNDQQQIDPSLPGPSRKWSKETLF